MAFFVAIGLVVSVCGEHFEVTSAQQLIKLLNISEANHFDANITLLDDLDFSGSALTLPFGVSPDGFCVSYTGVFEGNGHTIKGLVMNNTENQEYDNAGLFCALENATFENLVIDSSCSFTGSSYAGALSVSLTGSFTATNATNKAVISGDYKAGGFIGIIQVLGQRTKVTFKDCVNDGNVTGRYCLGGFVGDTYGSANTKKTISNCVNNGLITGSDRVGGFTGDLFSTRESEVIISDCVNNGPITGEGGVGGFVGGILLENGKSVILFNCTNTGEINGTKYAGGLVGGIGSELDHDSFSIISSANKGNVSAVFFACGMICVYSEYGNNVNATVMNSINKGSVNTTINTYGITNNITKAGNVVSMGEVNASSGSFTFWQSPTDVDLFFGLDSKCVNCTDGTTLFVHNTKTGFYEVVGSGEHVHDLLNAEVKKQNYGMFWTKRLELVEPGELSGGNKHGV